MPEDNLFDEEQLIDDQSSDLPEDMGALVDDVITPDQLLARFGLDDGAEAAPEEADVEPEPAPEAAPEPEPEPDPVLEAMLEETGDESAADRWDRLADLTELDQELDEALPVERAWFVIHCYSGYEYKVKHNLEQRIESMGMQDYIFQVVVPTVEEIEIKDGKRRTVERCLFPGYIMVQLVLTDDSWYVVRNTPGVTGFVGMGNKPVPLRQEQVQGILRRMEAEAPQIRATFKSGQKVRIIEGPFADFIGEVDDIDEERAKLRVLVSFFGRETPVELDFLQVEKA